MAGLSLKTDCLRPSLWSNLLYRLSTLCNMTVVAMWVHDCLFQWQPQPWIEMCTRLVLFRGINPSSVRFVSLRINQARVYLQAYRVGYKIQCPDRKGRWVGRKTLAVVRSPHKTERSQGESREANHHWVFNEASLVGSSLVSLQPSDITQYLHGNVHDPCLCMAADNESTLKILYFKTVFSASIFFILSMSSDWKQKVQKVPQFFH